MSKFNSGLVEADPVKKVTLSGKVTDFMGSPMPHADILIKDHTFADLYTAKADDNGNYQIVVKQGMYYAIAVVKDYVTKYLEYWAWNVPLYEDTTINAQINTLELYAVNAFRPQGAHPSIFIYFRPMSLKRHQEISKKDTSNEQDICPDLTDEKSIKVLLNGTRVKLLEVHKVKEYCGDNAEMFAYLIQVSLPKKDQPVPFWRIDLSIKDFQTNEEGAACTFLPSC